MTSRRRLFVFSAAALATVASVAACVGDDPDATSDGAPDASTTPSESDASAGADGSGPGDDEGDGGRNEGGPAPDGGASFDPKSIAGLTLWLDATKGVGTTGTVVNWVDQVTLRAAQGNGTYGIDASTETCVPPARIEGAIKGKAVVRFNGTTNCVVMGDDFFDRFRDFRNGFTAFLVTRPGTAVGAGVYEALLDFSPDGSETGDYVVITRRDGTPAYSVSNPMTGIEVGAANASAFITDETHALTVSAAPGDAGAFTSNSIRFFIDGTMVASSSQPAIHVPRVLSRNRSVVGRYVPGNGSPTFSSPGWFRGDVAEILVWFRELSPAERGAVDAYLKARWLP